MARSETMNWRLLALVFALVVAIFVARTAYNAGRIPLIADSDDAMRLVVVRDFLAGQGWYDAMQHRMNAPFGAELHWSRLADLPLAIALILLRPLLGDMSETVAAYLVPLLLLFPLLYLSGRVALKLVGREGLLPALVLPAFSLSVLGEFAPGRLDHHSLQILLLLAMLWCTLEALDRPRFAIGAGIAAATSIALGIEGIPSVAATILAFGIVWIAVPARADAMRLFGLSFGLVSAAHLAIALPPGRWLLPACDAISVVYVLAALGTGAVFIGLSLLPAGAWPLRARLVLGIAAGAALATALAIAFPDCARGPYSSLDPWLRANWIDKITEAAPLVTSLLHDPVYPVAVAVPTALALGVAAVAVIRRAGQARVSWLVYLVFLALATATMLLQIRASRMATVAAVPASAALIIAARHLYIERRTLLSTGGLVLSWLASASLAVALLVTLITGAFPGLAPSAEDQALADRRQCLMPDAFADIAALPPQRVMAPIDLGSHMLLFTPHAVVAAPYHRNQAGVRDTFAFFNAPIGEAHAILEQRGVSLVVVCPALPEMGGLPQAAPDSFVRLLAAGDLPDWLAERQTRGSPLRVFFVQPRD